MNRRKFLSYSARSWMMAGIVPGTLAENEMGEHNQHRRLSFSNDWIESSLFAAVREMPVADGIVVNLSPAALNYRVGADHGTISPWKSSTLRNCMIEGGERIALLHVRERTNLGAVALKWAWYGERSSQFPRTTPLYISSQEEIGEVQFDPIATFTHEVPPSPLLRRYHLKLNLWYTPEETDCGIHTGHPFIEVHTQVLGTGHMQKFRDNNAAALYEDVTMSPGFTHDPFFTLAKDGGFTYPWHRYYAETDCIWMAIELHPS